MPDWTEVVAAATRAPSIHNTQPWRFTGAPDRLAVRFDPERALPVLDPTHRQQVISCGVAAEFAAVALRARDLDVEVAVLPDPGDPDHLADVRVLGGRPAGDPDRALAAAIAQRHTTREPFLPRTVPAELLEQLRLDAGALGVWAEPIAREDAELVTVFLLHRAEEAEQGDPAYLAELEVWLRTDPEAVDGIPVGAAAQDDPAARPSNWLVRDFLVGQRRPPARRRRSTTTPRRRPWSGRPCCCWAPWATTGPPGWPPAGRWGGCCSGSPPPAWPPAR